MKAYENRQASDFKTSSRFAPECVVSVKNRGVKRVPRSIADDIRNGPSPRCHVVVKTFCLLALGLYAVLSIVDFVLTFALLQLSDGLAYESNPLAAACLDRHGWYGLAAYKTLFVFIFIGTVAFVTMRKKWVGAALAVYGCAVLVSVVMYSQQLIGEARQEVSMRSAAFGPPPPDPLKEPYLGLFAKK